MCKSWGAASAVPLGSALLRAWLNGCIQWNPPFLGWKQRAAVLVCRLFHLPTPPASERTVSQRRQLFPYQALGCASALSLWSLLSKQKKNATLMHLGKNLPNLFQPRSTKELCICLSIYVPSHPRIVPFRPQCRSCPELRDPWPAMGHAFPLPGLPVAKRQGREHSTPTKLNTPG